MTTPPIGDIVYLASALIRTKVLAQSTMPDTPGMYGAELEVLGNQGEMDLTPLAGKTGENGKAQFPLRHQDDPIDNVADLPVLTSNLEDIGKYWLIDTVDAQGTVIAQHAHVWYGTSYRTFVMGVRGAPGPVPNIRPRLEVIDPDEVSKVTTDGPTLAPTWKFSLAHPPGPVGPVRKLYDFPDFDDTSAPRNGDVIGCSGTYNSNGQVIWKPFSILALNPRPYSVPETAFSAYSGIAQQAPIGSFAIPPQPFQWTPIVWGHLGAGGVNLSNTPLMVGAQVLLGNPKTGIQIARGLGNPNGEVNIMPHYSYGNNRNQSLSPVNNYAVVPANHTNPADGTVYINLWNDGALGAYNFQPSYRDPITGLNELGAQLFILVVPIEPYRRTHTTRRVAP